MIELDKIYNEDCLEGMKRIADGAVDCIITDLPYGTTRNPWDSVIPLDQLWEQFKRVTKKNAAIVLFSQQPFTSQLIMSNPYMFKHEWIWEKDSGTGFLNANYAPLKRHENICVFSKSAACYVKDADNAMTFNPQKSKGSPYKCKQGSIGKNYDYENSKKTVTVNNGERNPTDVVYFISEPHPFHPTQKPVDLLRYLILTYTNVGGVVLDATIGSGTTAVAALMEKRHFIGFETNKEYFDIAQGRIDDVRRNPTLF